MTAKFEKTPGKVNLPPPKLSQHTKEILSEIGFSDEDMEQLKKNNVI